MKKRNCVCVCVEIILHIYICIIYADNSNVINIEIKNTK